MYSPGEKGLPAVPSWFLGAGLTGVSPVCGGNATANGMYTDKTNETRILDVDKRRATTSETVKRSVCRG